MKKSSEKSQMTEDGRARGETVNEDARSAILSESLTILREEGIGGLSIRKVAANLGLSHAAPYRHYPTRDHILAALTESAFALFLETLRRDLPPIYETEKLHMRLLKMCDNYYAFAFENPDYYRFMFGPPVFAVTSFPEVQQRADAAFHFLVEQMSAMVHARAIAQSDPVVLSMFVFSTMHGSASLMLNGITGHLVADGKTRDDLAKFLQAKILSAISG